MKYGESETKAHRKERRLVGKEFGKKLTPSEVEILELVARGHSNLSIGVQLGIRESTVKNHMNSALQRLGVSDRTSAVLKALEMGYDIYKPKSGTGLDRVYLKTKLSGIESRLSAIGEELQSIGNSLS